MKIRRQGGQPVILKGAADGEVIEALKGISLNAEQVVNNVVEVAADAGRTDAGRLRFQVQHLAQHSRLPKQTPVPPWAPVTDRVAKLGEHAEAERPRPRRSPDGNSRPGKSLAGPLRPGTRAASARGSREAVSIGTRRAGPVGGVHERPRCVPASINLASAPAPGE